FDLTIRCQDPNETRYTVNSRAQTSLAFTQRFLRPFAFGQIEDERKALITSFFNERGTNKHGDAAAVFSKIFLLEGRNDPCRAQLFPRELIALAPLRGTEIAPSQTTPIQVFTLISQDAEKRVIGLNHLVVSVGNKDSDDIRVDQAPNLRFPICEITIKP